MSVLRFGNDDDVDVVFPQVATHLANSGILAYPTETVYGFGSRPTAQDVAHLATFKGRPPAKPFLLLVSGIRMVEDYGLTFTPAAEAMARTYWPGPLTLVLPGAEGKLPDSLRGKEGGIAVRWSSHALVSQLIAHLGYPITSTSANRPGQPPAPGAGGILDTFNIEIERGELLVLDGGVLGRVPSSTLVDCTATVPRLIREGAIPRSELQVRLGSLAP